MKETKDKTMVLTIIVEDDGRIRTDIIGELDAEVYIQATGALLVQASSLNKEAFDASLNFMREVGYSKMFEAQRLKDKLEDEKLVIEDELDLTIKI